MAPFVFVPVEYSTEGAIHSKFNGLQHNLAVSHAEAVRQILKKEDVLDLNLPQCAKFIERIWVEVIVQ